MKKLLAVLLCMSLLPALVFAGGSQGSASAGGPAEFTATFLKNDWHGDPGNMTVLTKLEKEANVKVNWQVYPNATWGERKNLILNSGDLPDVFYMNAVNQADIERYGPQGLFVDLTNLIPQYAPRLVKAFERIPLFKSLSTSPTDGKIYMVCRAAEREANVIWGQMYFYQPWLDKLGLKMPTTHLELVEVLRAFKTRDPNGNGRADELPFVFSNGEGSYSLTQFFAMFGYGYFGYGARGDGGFYATQNGKAVFVPGTDRFKEAVIWIQSLFAEGLLNEEDFASNTTMLQNSKLHNDPVVAGSFLAFDSNIVAPANRLADYTRLEYPIKGPHGDQVWFCGAPLNNMGGSQFVMTNRAKDQAAIMRWLDAHFDPITSAELFLGPVGTTLFNNNGVLDYMPTPAGISYSEFRYGNCPVHVPLIVAGDDWGKVVQIMDEDATRLNWIRNTLKPYMQHAPAGYATADESRWLLAQGKDIGDYIRPIQAKWMIQGGIEQEWDAFQARLRAMGVDEMTRIVQAQMDRIAQFSK